MGVRSRRGVYCVEYMGGCRGGLGEVRPEGKKSSGCGKGSKRDIRSR